MTGSKGNSEFCFSSTSMFPSASPRGTLRVSGKPNSLLPLGPLIRAYWICRAIGSHGDWGALYQTIQYWIIPRWGEWSRHHFSYPPNAIFENPATNSGKAGRSMLRLYMPHLFDFPSPTRGSGFISKADEDISVRSKRSYGWYEKAGKLAAHCSLFELN